MNIIPGAAYLYRDDVLVADDEGGLWHPSANTPIYFPGSLPAYPKDLILLYVPGDEVLRTTQTLWSTGPEQKQVTQVRVVFKEPRDA